MSVHSRFAIRAALCLALSATGSVAIAAPILAPMPTITAWDGVVPARNLLRGFADFLNDDDDNYVHDDHYDWQAYRDSTSRKDRIRDYYEMQREAQKDYWKHQKDAQKKMIKQQRGW
ncbi:hypothetical protein [Bosea sp. BH3]|uniref:hypothetical protein n=1 Tax=Bosea sp. BH3 TaxID=2871701 RepID=UPI0021CAFE34|nr:hypothetical protein [Bosea sp. BH3]MCU4179610.1 hypothetical protein [Bosea sp. BH3]